MNAVAMSDGSGDKTEVLAYGKIPVRNVWFLFLYAYDLARFRGRFEAEIEDSPDFKSLIARLLCHVVEVRLRRNLSFGYHRREERLKRVRGRIDILTTTSRDLFRRGEIACRFEELTVDTPRNRFVRSALTALGYQLDEQILAHRTKSLANALGRIGVSDIMPSRAGMTTDQIGRHETDDRLMVSLAQAVFDLVLPTEARGSRVLLDAQRGETEFRKLFERAVGNFFAAELPREEGWRVHQGKQLQWPIGFTSPGIAAHFPMMITDIIVENDQHDRKIVVDCKFTNILTKAQYGDNDRFKTAHIYQIYSYLRSQEHSDSIQSMRSEGMLLYPSVGFDLDEVAEIQGHLIRFVTLDLSLSTDMVVEALRRLVLPVSPACNPI